MAIDRRSFVKYSAGLIATPGLGGCGDGDFFAAADLSADVRFPNGIVAGSPLADQITLVSLIEGQAGPSRLGLEVSEREDFATLVLRQIIEVPAPAFENVPLQISVSTSELEPARRYFYRLRFRDGSSPIGRFVTLRRQDDPRPVRIGYFSCQSWQGGYYTAHAALAKEPGLDLVLSLGDYIYELTKDRAVESRIDTIGIDGNGFAESLEEYRQKYRLYRSDSDLQAMHAAQTFMAIWDNHELAEDAHVLSQGLKPRISEDDRKANGRTAFFEHMPMKKGPQGADLYRRHRVGANLELFFLDLHSFADPLSTGTGGSYLGAAQLAWLLEGLRTSTARFKVIVSSSVMMGLTLSDGGEPLNRNQWDGYPEERRQIVEYIRKNDIRGVVVISGDLHMFLAAPVTTTGHADGEAGLVEFTGGAISSEAPASVGPGDEPLARQIESVFYAANPHLRYINVLPRGYALLDVSPDELLVTYRGVKTVYAPQSGVYDVRRFRVRHGQNSIEFLDE